MTPITKTYLPELKEYNKYLQKIWKTGFVTNNGPLVQELEKKLKAYLGTSSLCLVTNGTLALQIAIKAFNFPKDSEIITTPFSYVATTSSIVWEGHTPVFVDIEPDYLTIDPKKIEEAITKKTVAILATHVYGNPCDVEQIEKIAKKHNLKVIYDAAHAFGAKYKGKHLVNYGDASILSFHATKIFHTGEGGAVVCNDKKAASRVPFLRNFGHKGYDEFKTVGINGKMSELHAAMGLSVLPKVRQIIEKRKQLTTFYDSSLPDELTTITPRQGGLVRNYAYYPVIFNSESELLKAKQSLENHQIYPRRYFYPALNKLPYLQDKKRPVVESISKRILCLPLYFSLNKKTTQKISKVIMDQLMTAPRT